MFSTSNFIFGGATQSVAMGYYSNYNTGVIDAGGPYGLVNQYGNAIAIGNNAAQFSQGTNAIAIGSNAGQYSQGRNAIAIGQNAGRTLQPTGSIVINASGNVISGSNSYACYINPIQDNNSSTNRGLTFNPATFEVNYNSAFRFVPWTDCGYTVVAGSSFGGLITASTTAPTPATGSTTTYKYSVIGNTMYLQFTYINNTANVGTTGTGGYYYNLPTNYTVNSGAAQIASAPNASVNQSAYGTILGVAALEGYLNNFACGASVYATSATQLSIFVPTFLPGSTYWFWNSSGYYGYNNSSFHITFNAAVPI